MRYLIWIVDDTVADAQIDRMRDEFYSVMVSLASHDHTVVSPHVMRRMAEIGYLADLDWMSIGDDEARSWIADHRREQM